MYNVRLKTLAASYGIVPTIKCLRTAIKRAEKEWASDVIYAEITECGTGRVVARKVAGVWKYASWIDLWHAKFGIEI